MSPCSWIFQVHNSYQIARRRWRERFCDQKFKHIKHITKPEKQHQTSTLYRGCLLVESWTCPVSNEDQVMTDSLRCFGDFLYFLNILESHRVSQPLSISQYEPKKWWKLSQGHATIRRGWWFLQLLTDPWLNSTPKHAENFQKVSLYIEVRQRQLQKGEPFLMLWGCWTSFPLVSLWWVQLVIESGDSAMVKGSPSSDSCNFILILQCFCQLKTLRSCSGSPFGTCWGCGGWSIRRYCSRSWGLFATIMRIGSRISKHGGNRRFVSYISHISEWYSTQNLYPRFVVDLTTSVATHAQTYKKKWIYIICRERERNILKLYF